MSRQYFYKILMFYSILCLLISFSIIKKYTLHFEILALFTGLVGYFSLAKNIHSEKKEMQKRMHILIFSLSILAILFFRIIPYLDNSVPIGYDSGIYKYAMDSFSYKGFSSDTWIRAAFEPGFLYSSFFLRIFFSSEFILTYIFILACVLLGISVYLFTSSYADKNSAIISLVVYSLSLVQFKVFGLLYFKNILGLSFMLLAFHFLKNERRALFITFSILTGIFHRPTFIIFLGTYILFSIYNYKNVKTNLLNIIIILIAISILYLGFFQQAIIPFISPVANSISSPGNSPGTFMSFKAYQFSSLIYIPFAVLGLLLTLKRRKIDIPLFWFTLNFIIVIFQLFFFNRFIIHLDIIIIFFSSLGLLEVFEKKKVSYLIIAILIFASLVLLYKESTSFEPILSRKELELIERLNQTEENSSIISISSEYSPYILAYSARKTIAPGLFDINKWSEEEWNIFWKTNSSEETKSLMSLYEKPIYLYAGNKNFSNPCFQLYIESQNNKVYKYTC